MDDATVGANVRRLREAAGMSQAWLAVTVQRLGWEGVYPQTILKIEKGQRSLKLTEAVVLARALHVGLSEIVSTDSTDPAWRDWANNVAPVFRERDIARRNEDAAAASLAELGRRREQAEALATEALRLWCRRNPEAAATRASEEDE